MQEMKGVKEHDKGDQGWRELTNLGSIEVVELQ